MVSPVVLLGREAGEFVVNSVTIATQEDPRVARLASGGFVVVWTDYSLIETSGAEIKAQVYNPLGVRIGGEISVNASLAGNQTDAVVTGLAGGGFAIAWADSSAAEWGKIQIFDPSGNKLGGSISDMPGSGINYPFDIAGLNWGGFVVTRPLGIGQIYDAAGTPVGPGFSVGTGNQSGGTVVAALSNGNFVVAVAKAGGAAIQLFDQNGGKIGAEIATSSSNINGGFQIGALDNGGFVLAWGSLGTDGMFDAYGARAQIFSATGAPLGGEIALNSGTEGDQVEPSVVGVAGGGFLATWTNTDSSGSTVRGQVFTAAGEKAGTEFLVSLGTDPSGIHHVQPAVAAIGGDRFALVWHGVGAGDGVDPDGMAGGIRGQILQALGPVTLDIVPSTSSLSEIAVGNVPAIAFSTLSPAINASYTYELLSETTGGGLSLTGDRLFVIDNRRLDHETAPVATVTVRATDNAGNVVEEAVQFGIADAVNELRYVGGSEATIAKSFSQTQNGVRAAPLTGGGFVVTWTRDNSDGTFGSSVAAQVYDAAGDPVGAEFRVNTSDESRQFSPAVTATASGGFAISWSDDSDNVSRTNIRAQIFDAAATKVGGEIAVNGSAPSTQGQTAIASLADGGFVVGWFDEAWTLGDAHLGGLHGQLLDAAGNKVGTEFLINTATRNGQRYLALEGLPAGGFIAAWTDDSREAADTSASAIKAQLFDASGSKVGGEILVNSSYLGMQAFPSVAVAAGGNLLIVWQHLDGPTGGIRGQLFDAAGNRIGGELILDAGFSSGANVEPGPAGGFVVSWTAVSPLDGSQTGVFGLLLSSTGARIGDPFLINQIREYGQSAAEIVTLADGALAAVWHDWLDAKLRLFVSADQVVARDDALATNENAVLGGNLFADNGHGADIGSPLEIAAVNGSAAAVGQQVTLASGAKLIVNSNGSFSYDPAAAFADLADRSSGASNISRNDSFAYTLRDGSSATAIVTVHGVYSQGNILQGTENADIITGIGFDETLNGLGAGDFLTGGSGIDTIDGGGGDDIAQGGAGNDILRGGIGQDILRGEDGDDFMYGQDGNDLLRGGTGVDTFDGGLHDGAAGPTGPWGDRIDFFEVRATQGARADLRTGIIANDGFGNAETMTRIESLGADTSFADIFHGNDQRNLIVAGKGDTVHAYGGDDRVELGLAAAIVDGGAGTDTLNLRSDGGFLMPDANGDGAAEISGPVAGGWIVDLTSTYLRDGLGNAGYVAGFEYVEGSDGADQITGNGVTNVISGGAGNDVLNGAGGSDRTEGGLGNDLHYVDHVGDIVVELEGEGVDTVASAISYILAANVEHLQANDVSGSAPLHLTGNALANTIYATQGDNILNGAGGADFMVGYAGNDLYYVDHVGDVAYEMAGGGVDTVIASISFAIGANIESLQANDIGGSAALTLTGNELSNQIYATQGNNVLNGGGGADFMVGYAGHDLYYVDDLGDLAFEMENGGNDVVVTTISFTLGAHVENLQANDIVGTQALVLTGNALANTIYGTNGNNVLNGAGGADFMAGYGGHDLYYVDNANDVAYEDVNGGNDIVVTTVSYGLGGNVENLQANDIGGTAALTLVGNDLANTIWGTQGDNALYGRGGNDRIYGYGGADRFVFDSAAGDANFDWLDDFQAGVDKIVLDNAIFSGLADGALPANAFVTGGAAADADDRILFNPANGGVFYDADGSGTGAALLIAVVPIGQALTAADFVVI